MFSHAAPARRWIPRILLAEWVWLLIVAIGLVLAARYLIINLLLPTAADPDEGVYLMVARLLNRGYSYDAFYFDQFFLFPQLLALAFRLFGDTLEIGRMTVVALSVGGLLAMVLLARQLGAKWAAPLVVVFGILNHYYLSQSRFAMADVPSVAFMLWALVMMLAFHGSGRRIWLAASAVFCVFSLLIKPLSVGFCIPLGFWLVTRRVAHKDGKWGVDLRALALDVGVFGLAGFLAAAPFVQLFDLPGEYQRTVGFHFDEKDWYAPLMTLREKALVSFQNENRMWLGLAALGAVTASLRRPMRAIPLLVGEALSVVVLLQLPPWWHHYTLLTPLVAVFAAVAVHDGIRAIVQLVARLRAPAGQRSLTRRDWAAVPVAIVFGAAALLLLHDLPQVRTYNIDVLLEPAHDAMPLARFLKKNFGSDAFYISDSVIVVYLANGLLPPSAINLPYESTYRFSQDAQTKLEQSINNYHVQAIVVTGSYRRNKPLMAWISSHFPAQIQGGGGDSDTLYGEVYMETPQQTAGGPQALSPLEPPPNDYEDTFWQQWQ